MSTVDRWFVSHYSGQDALGLYAVGAKFALLVTMAVNTFRQAWAPVAMDAMHSEDGPGLFRTVGRLYLGCGAAGVVFITALSPYLVRWFAAPAYSAAYPIVGVLSWCSLFFGTFLIFSSGIAKAEKMIWMPVLMGFAALVNVVLSICLVPRYGGLGAAVATLIAFAVWNLAALLVSERLWPVRYHYAAMAVQVAIGICSCSLILLWYRAKVDNWLIWSFTIGIMIILMSLSLTREQFRKILSSSLIKRESVA